MQDLFDLILSNRIYMIIAGIVAVGIFIFLLKKVFKMAMLVVVIVLGYGVYLYATEDDPMKVIQKKLDSGKTTMDKLDNATEGLRKEALDKVIDDVDKKLKEASKKR